MAFTIGGCFCNDLRHVAHAKGVKRGRNSVSVKVQLAGEPTLATSAIMVVTCETLAGTNAEAVIEEAKASCMATNSLRCGVPVDVRAVA
ncbi:MAG: OsmC family protein [Hyphomicrobiaceae bacterium]